MFSKISRTSVVALCISVVAFAGGLQSERAAAVGFTTATPDAPVQAGHGSGAIERVDAADRLLIASEELASAACHLHAGVAADEARSRVLKKLELFPRTIEALEFGASDLGIHGAETRRKTLKQIHAMRTIWTEMETPLRTLTEQGIPDPQKAALKASNVELVNTAENLFTEISGEYANPFELLAVDLLLLNISGRQALLAQRVAKEACYIWSGERTQAHIDELNSAMQMFTLGVKALLDGMPELGVIPAPNDKIRSALLEVREDWDVIVKELDDIVAGVEDVAIYEDLYHRLNVKTDKLHDIVGLYADYAHHQY